MLVGFFERFIDVKSVSIEYRAHGKERAIRIPDIITADVKAISGQQGGDTTVQGHPLCLAPGQPLVVARSQAVVLKDHWSWDFGGSAGGYSAFKYHN